MEKIAKRIVWCCANDRIKKKADDVQKIASSLPFSVKQGTSDVATPV